MLRYWEKKPLHLKRSAPKYYEAWVRVRKSMKHPEADEKPESEFSWFSYVFIRFHTLSWGYRKFQHFNILLVRLKF